MSSVLFSFSVLVMAELSSQRNSQRVAEWTGRWRTRTIALTDRVISWSQNLEISWPCFRYQFEFVRAKKIMRCPFRAPFGRNLLVIINVPISCSFVQWIGFVLQPSTGAVGDGAGDTKKTAQPLLFGSLEETEIMHDNKIEKLDWNRHGIHLWHSEANRHRHSVLLT